MSLNISVCDMMQDIVTEITKKGKMIKARPGTPLAFIQASTFVPEMGDINTPELYGEHLRIMEEFNRDKGDRISSHTDAINASVDAAIPGIRNQLHVYRNIVNPTIKDLLEKIDYDLQNISNKPVSNMEIVEWNLPIPYYNEKLEDLSYRYSSHGTVEVTLKEIAEIPSSTELYELMYTGIATLDESIKSWLSTIPDDYITTVWADIFTKTGSMMKLMVNKDQGHAYALIAYLLAEKLVTHEPLDCFKTTRAVFVSHLSAIRDFAGKFVYQYIQKNKKSIEEQNLILNISNNTTTVHAVVYDAWLEAGGTPEILLGNMLNKQRVMYGQLLMNNAQDLTNKWNSYYAMQKQQLGNMQVSNIRYSIEKNFNTQMNEARQKIRNNEKIDIPSIEECDNIEKLFKQEINSYGGFTLENLPSVVTKLVCRSRFYKTDAEIFLSKLNKIMNDNPDLPPFEASTIATIEYIVEWSLTQTELK